MFRLSLVLLLLGVFLCTARQASGRVEDKSINPPSESAAGEDGFVALTPDQRPKVSGKVLMVAAYTVIFVVLLFYCVSLIRRERAVRKAALELEHRLR